MNLADMAFRVYATEKARQQIEHNEFGQVTGINEPENATDLKDYKFFSFDGLTRVMFIATDKASKT